MAKTALTRSLPAAAFKLIISLNLPYHVTLPLSNLSTRLRNSTEYSLLDPPSSQPRYLNRFSFKGAFRRAGMHFTTVHVMSTIAPGPPRPFCCTQHQGIGHVMMEALLIVLPKKSEDQPRTYRHRKLTLSS
jgi:hypothetical protein